MYFVVPPLGFCSRLRHSPGEDMPETPQQPAPPPARPTYRWPWFVAAAALLGILLAVLWMSREVERTRRLREWNTPTTTNASPTRP